MSTLIGTLYQDLNSLVVGRKYSSGTLGYYNRGKQFPQFIILAVDGAVKSVMLPTMSAKQEDKACVKAIMRRSIIASAYAIFPLMAGLAAVAEPTVRLLLTDKWLPCVPYIQVYCVSLAFYPVHSCNLQAINAVGRSDIFLKLEIIKKIIGISALTFAVFMFDSPIAIARTGVITSIISCFINSYPNKKLINYSYFEQMKDLIPSIIMSAIMFMVVLFVGKINLNLIMTLLIQVAIGAGVYLLLSLKFQKEMLGLIIDNVKKILGKK